MKELENFTMPTPQECGFINREKIILDVLIIIKDCISKKNFKIGLIDDNELLKYGITVLHINQYLEKFGWVLKVFHEDYKEGQTTVSQGLSYEVVPLDSSFFKK